MIIRAEIKPTVSYLQKHGIYEIRIPEVKREDVDNLKKITNKNRCFYERMGAIEIPMPSGEIIRIHF